MICNPKIKLEMMRDAVKQEYSTLIKGDHKDPDIELQLANNRILHNILNGDDAEAIEKELFGMVQDLKDPLTNSVKKALAGSDNKITIWVGKTKRRELVKAVNFIKGETQDRIEIATYPSTKPNSVRTYSFAVGSDFGVGRQIAIKEDKREYNVRIEGVGAYTKYLRDSRTILGNKEAEKDFFNGTEKKVNDYVHGSINHMKNMFNELGAEGDYGRYGRGLLNSFKPKFFKDMELFLGEVEKEESEGKTGSDWLSVYKSSIPSADRNVMSASEVYLHEVIHTMTRFALDEKSPKAEALSRELNYLVKEAMESISVEDLYPKNATQTEKDIVKERYDYIFNNEKGPDIGNQEFLAFALTNPDFMDKLKGIGAKEEDLPLMDRIVDFFYKLSRVLLGELDFKSKDKNLYERAYNLAYRLGEINVEAENNKSKIMQLSENINNLVNMIDEGLADKIQAAKDGLIGEPSLGSGYPYNGSRLEKTKYLMKFFKYGATTEEGNKIFGLIFSSLGLDPKSSIREFFGSFFERSSTEKIVDWLGLSAGKIDTMRESEVNTSRSIILEAFNNELKEFEDEALTKYLIDTNFGVIYKGYGLDSIKDFIESNELIDSEIVKLKGELKNLDKKNYNWLVNQAHGLGYYMANHVSNIAQNTSAYNIAKGSLSNSSISYSKSVEDTISKIAALTAMKYTKGSDSDVIIDLINRNPEGVKTVINMYEGFKTFTRETVFKNDPVHMVDGYSSEQFDDNIELKVLPRTEAERLKSLGFKKIKDLGRKNSKGEVLSLYVSEGYGVKERLRGAAKLVSMSAKGTSLAETIYGNSLNPALELSVETKLLHKKRKEIADLMAKGEFNFSENLDNMMPLLNSDGEVVSYRYVMSKASKKEFLGQDTRVTEVLPRSKGHVIDKIYTLDQNAKVLDFIKDDMENNWKGSVLGGPKGLTEYTIISENSPNEEIRELFKMLPREFKEYALSRDDKSIAVPTNLFYPIFGYQHLSIVHNKWSNKFPEFVVKIAGMLEELWMDMVKIVKGNILMKTPIVLLGNIISNFIFRVINGAEPLQLMKDYYRSFKDVREFTKNNREILRLENQVVIDKEEYARNPNKDLDSKIKKNENAIKRYKAINDKNPVKELVDAGLYQAIVEDVEVSSIEGHTVWDKIGNSILGKLPSGAQKNVKTGADIIYLNQKTKWFKINQEVMQLSDLVARDVQNRTAKALERKQLKGETNLPTWWLKEKGWDKDRKLKTAEEINEFKERSKDVRMYALLDNYVNYSRPSGRGEEYLNRMGILMFTKYAKRIQKVIMDQSTHYPLKTFLAVMFSNSIMNISSIQDASILSKDWHTETHGMGNFYPIYSPLEHIENFITPSLFKSSTWDFLPI